jgi:hypothetical protein
MMSLGKQVCSHTELFLKEKGRDHCPMSAQKNPHLTFPAKTRADAV